MHLDPHTSGLPQHQANPAYQGLRDSLGPGGDTTFLDRAWAYLVEHGAGSTADTGEELPLHGLAVARIVAHEMGLGLHSVNAALLHIFAADGTDLATLRGAATPEAFSILGGLKKIRAIRTDRSRYQSENFIKLLLTVPDDIRSPLVRLADRLHHLRQFRQLSPDRRQQIAGECAYLYAPVAHRLGLYRMKSEMEDLAMQVLEPEAYQAVTRMVSDSEAKQRAY
ncbi:MAG TPA: HD domain-containing protein, partial [Bacteroidales bacterium]|nr:HD domain-containing protein [Bacteroidales bacterium]